MRWGWIGAAAGALLGVFDFLLLTEAGAGMPVDGEEFGRILLTFLVTMFALLGYALGRLADERLRAKRDARVIRAQLESLEKAHLALVQQEKLAAIGKLAAGIAHEVRNPLGVIRSSAAMVREELSPGEDAYRACQFICEETDRLNGVITALLEFSRPLEPKMKPFRGEQVVDSALRLVSKELGARAIRVERRLNGDPLELRADFDLTTQALYGLLLNAAEAVADGGAIEISLSLTGESLRLEVADDGPGVPEGAAEQVFEPFYTSKPKGTGLGLPMVRRSVEAQGGRCLYVPRGGLGPQGRGARFRIELPA
jgi:two-component system sensor histidine kinase HydH